MPDTLENNLKNRAKILDALAGEVFGPDSHLAVSDDGERLPRKGEAYTPSGSVLLTSWDDYNKFIESPKFDKESNEEILLGETPLQRYGTGVLSPSSAEDQEENEHIQAQEAIRGYAVDVEEGKVEDEEKEKVRGRKERNFIGDSDAPEHDVFLSTLRKPRSIGVSFVVEDIEKPFLAEVRGGFYKASPIKVLNNDGVEYEKSSFWVRNKFTKDVELSFKQSASPIKLTQEGDNSPELELSVNIRGRSSLPQDSQYPATAGLVTVCLVNRGDVPSYREVKMLNHESFFQSQLTIRPASEQSKFLPYPEPSGIKTDQESESFGLLYRDSKTFATGHGAAGTWENVLAGESPHWVKAEVLPLCQTPGITSEVEFGGEKVEVSLASLSDLSTGRGFAKLESLLELYQSWIAEKTNDTSDSAKVGVEHKVAAMRHLEEMNKAATRMEAGLKLLKDDPEARQIFEWTNHAMHIQSAVPKAVREPNVCKRGYWSFTGYVDPSDCLDRNEIRKWRPFQIAFLLMNLSGLHSSASSDREIVDLIWFPTGGGKTEAYLACAAYALFRRRQIDPKDTGTEVIMRYTLRLLTAQQFERASALICSMNIIRKQNLKFLGADPFSIGIWVGGTTTPNLFKTIKKTDADYNLVLLKCPWCGAKMGPRRTGKNRFESEGFTAKKFHCPDQACKFYEELPLHVVDEHLYDFPPSYLIATVDKFAMLAWNERPRSFFGIGRDGKQSRNPPGLIIQDELHLITGPLGSMVGLYEAVISELCSTQVDGSKAIPKLIAATATTRASAKQISELYGRPNSGVFPPSGLDARDSFFARYDEDEDGKLKPARQYLGFLGLNYSSALTSSVRLTSALHSAVWMLPEDERDPWWTLLYFYNAIRELGGGLSLYDSDIGERMKNVQLRWIGKWDKEKRNHRWINRSRELTGRLQNSEIPERLKELETRYSAESYQALDACLASNIIEVGVDVDRLSLMAVQGQPKTTAQYIQATGRIGRNSKRPGLVVVNYGAQKGRDRSHYEHFQAYHGRLYAQVEPSSVTPYTLPVMKRALHATLVAWMRQRIPKPEAENTGCADISKALLKAEGSFYELFKQRVEQLKLNSLDHEKLLMDMKNILQGQLKKAEVSKPECWHAHEIDSEDRRPLQVQYGKEIPIDWGPDTMWHSPTSMRSVDSECSIHIRPATIQTD